MHARSVPALIPEDGGSLWAGACDLPEVAPGAGRAIRPGDVGPVLAPGEKHWHGATPKTAMTHIAVQEALGGSAVASLEQLGQRRAVRG